MKKLKGVGDPLPLVVIDKCGSIVVDVFHRHPPSPLRLGVDAVSDLHPDFDRVKLLAVDATRKGQHTRLGVYRHEGLCRQTDGVGQVAVEVGVVGLDTGKLVTRVEGLGETDAKVGVEVGSRVVLISNCYLQEKQ